jgi:carbonic anhydrase
MAENERASTPDAGRAAPRLSSGQALQRLLDGNKRYVTTNFAHPDQTAERRIEVANAQYPFACILGCSDSRVPAEIVFDQGLGDLFMVRVAGNVASSGEVLGSIEFAVAELQVPLVLVLGHERCGAVTAAVEAVVRGVTPSGHIDSLVQAIRPAVLRVEGSLGDMLDNAVRANVELVVAQLARSEPILAPAVRAGRVRIAGARYDLDTGQVDIIT